MKDLTGSTIDRQNILNNIEAVKNLQIFLGVNGLFFYDEYRFTKEQVCLFYNVDVSTLDTYLSRNENELRSNGYELLKGKRLNEFKQAFSEIINIQSKTAQLGVFNFRAFLNLGMLLIESEIAKAVRSKILDIVIDTLDKKAGGSTKYINQRDEDFLDAFLQEPAYRKQFTLALNSYVDMGNYKYSYYTDEIYKAVFNENATEYKQVLRLEEHENPRDTMYSEVLTIIASFETGLAHEMKKKADELSRLLTKNEMDELLKSFAEHPQQKPYIETARSKMASRDYGFRQVLHEHLIQYMTSVDPEDYKKFLGDKSMSLEDRILENIELFQRLKDR
jgi:hypothetical protein